MRLTTVRGARPLHVVGAGVAALMLAGSVGVPASSASARATPVGSATRVVSTATACVVTVTYSGPVYGSLTTRTTRTVTVTATSSHLLGSSSARTSGTPAWLARARARSPASARGRWTTSATASASVRATVTRRCGASVTTGTGAGSAAATSVRRPTATRTAVAMVSAMARASTKVAAARVAAARARAASLARSRTGAVALVARISVASVVRADVASARLAATALARRRAVAAADSGRTVWHPARGLTWQWQLSGAIDTTVAAQVFDIDAQTNAASVVAALHARGARVICYIDAGGWEDYRPDALAFPASLLGGVVDGWPHERWLDIRQLAVLGRIMAARMDVCRSKGFDGVEADLVDGYTAATGFPLTAADQLAYDRMLASLAHARGLAIGLKNDLDQVVALEPSFDFAVNEQCFEYSECSLLAPFLDAGKAVFHAEYNRTTAQFCPTSKALGLSSILKTVDLTAWRQTC